MAKAKIETQEVSTDIKNNLETAILAVMDEVRYLKNDKQVGSYWVVTTERLKKALRPSMIRHGLTETIVSMTMHDQRGDDKKITSITAEFTVRLTHGETGESKDCIVLAYTKGEDDKIVRKLMTEAIRNALGVFFMINTGDGNDEFSDDYTDEENEKPATKTPQGNSIAAMPDDRFVAAITAIEQGKYTVLELMSKFDLTQPQLDALQDKFPEQYQKAKPYA